MVACLYKHWTTIKKSVWLQQKMKVRYVYRLRQPKEFCIPTNEDTTEMSRKTNNKPLYRFQMVAMTSLSQKILGTGKNFKVKNEN